MKLTPILATGLLLAMASAAGAETIRIDRVTAGSSPIHQAPACFQMELDGRSAGSFEVEIAPGDKLGSVRNLTNPAQSGKITMATDTAAHLSSADDELALLDQFLLFEDEEEARGLLDGDEGDANGDVVEERGRKNVGSIKRGFRSFTNSHAPLRGVDAFEGFRMRSADSPMAIAAWPSVGAMPVPLAWRKICSSLQQGLIGGRQGAVRPDRSRQIPLSGRDDRDADCHRLPAEAVAWLARDLHRIRRLTGWLLNPDPADLSQLPVPAAIRVSQRRRTP